jgi:murein DD-endopeptidase MepM/ murein hydrolase activator NlpD
LRTRNTRALVLVVWDVLLMKRRSIATVPVTAAFLLSMVTPPAVASSNSSSLSSSAQKAASLNDLKASDAQLVSAVSTLNNEVQAQQAAVASANQAVDAANQTVARVQAALAQSQQQLDVLKNLEAQRAVELYMSPGDNGDLMSALMAADGSSDDAQRQELSSVLSGGDYNTLDALESAERDFKKQQKDALDAQKTANDRRDAAQQKLNSLNVALADQSKAEASLKARIDSDAAEDEETAQAASSHGGSAPVVSSGGGKQSSQGLIWPVDGSHTITSPFGMRWGRMHEGIDIAANAGQPIYAAKAGTVTFAGQESGYGGYVCIQHGGGFQTCYAHETKILVSAGQQVSQHQELGLAGATGDATGVNLHFETCTSSGKECFYGQFHNPTGYLP